MRGLALILAGLIALPGALPGPAAALGVALQLPAPANRTYSAVERNTSFPLAIGPWRDGRIETLYVSGMVSVEAWRLPGNGKDSGLLLANLARQLQQNGYEVMFQCEEAQCGGFDFRFAIKVVAEPAMHVDLGDYIYLAARRPGPAAGAADSEYLALLISTSPGAGFVQLTHVLPAGAEAPEAALATVTSTMTEPADQAAKPAIPLGEQLEQNGYAVLSDLVFETGSSVLGAGPFASLAELAQYLQQHPQRSVTLVGHSDAEGALEVNITLSKRRAASVRTRLIEEYGLPEEQLAAEGVGYLAPLDSNLTEAGRGKNRRVEVVLTSTR